MFTQAEYYTEIKAVAQSVLDEIKDYGGDESDLVHQAVDGHQWIIYTAYNMQVLQHSSNDNAYFDNYGELTAVCLSGACGKMAFAAMEADVYEAIAELRGES